MEQYDMNNDNLKRSDIEVIRYNYVALKKLHIRANDENDRLNEENEKLKAEIRVLKLQNNKIAGAGAPMHKMLADAYTKINEDKDNYIKIIQKLEAENSELKA